MSVRRLSSVVVCLLLALPLSAQVTIQSGGTLSEVINNLYGGNGIQLRNTGHQAHFGDSRDFQDFSLVLQKTLQARPIYPVPSSVGVVSFQFNEETGAYERVQSSFGPILAERATTSGRGHANFSTSYTFSEFNTINGAQDIDLTLRHCLAEACTFGRPDAGFLRDVIRVNMALRLKTQVLTTSVVYGFTDRLDLGVVIPYLRNDLEVATRGSIIVDPASNPAIHQFDPTVETADQLAIGHAVGIGDIIARAKWQLPWKGVVDSAVLADLTLPTGAKDDFLGTGDVRLRGTMIASHTGKRFSPHLNAGYEVNFGTTELSSFDYRFGSEVAVTPRFTIIGDLLGTVTPSGGDEFRARAYNDQTLVGRSVIDGAIGGKYLLSPRALLTLNLIMPLNDEGIRAGRSVTFGVQTGL